MAIKMIKKHLGTLLLAGLTVGCATPKKEAMPQQTSPGSQQSLEYRIDVKPFSNFDPPNAGKFINLRGPMTYYILDGLDVEEQFFPETTTIKEYAAFKNQIYAIAKELGYAPEQVKSLTPKEALVFTTKIVARRMNYFGRSKDHEAKKEQENQRKKLQSIFSQIQQYAESTDEEKNQAAEGIKTLEELAKKRQEVQVLEKRLGDVAGVAAYRAGFDTVVSPSELFMEQQPIVCRQYAAITRDVFFVLKQENEHLKNTHVSVYKEKKHVWNQAATLYEKDGQPCIDITFFDSTWYDSIGNMEGYNESHFDSYLMLTSQVRKFTEAVEKTIQDQKQEKITAQKR